MQTLRKSSFGHDVVTLQQRLQELGFDVGKIDGMFGAKTEAALKQFQSSQGLTPDGVAGTQTFAKLLPQNAPSSNPLGNNLLSPKAYQLILEFEVSSESYYKQFLQHPTLPGVESGITIGIGYDLGYNNVEAFHRDWQALKQGDRDRLAVCCGLTKDRAKAFLDYVKDITIPWEVALDVFHSVTIPKFYKMTHEAFPGMEKIPPDAQGALVSLVFNRGPKTTGSRRKEIAEIKRLLAQSDLSMPELLKRIADLIRQMKRLWVGVPGLQRRRDAEASLVEQALVAAIH